MSDGVPLRRNRDFVRFLVGRFVSNAGDSLYSVAALWLVFELSGSSALVGVANALLLLPWVLQALAGPVVDRLPLKPLLVGSQVVQGVVVLVLPLAAATGRLTTTLLLVTVPVLSLATLVVDPAQSALVPRIVPDRQLSRGNSALATVTLGLDMVFDALGGVFIAVAGATALFALDAATFAVAAVLFAGMAVPAARDDSREGDIGGSALADYASDLREGVAAVRGSAFVHMTATAAVFNLAVGVTLATLPAFGASLGGPAAYGFLLGALGIGRLVGSAVAPRLTGLPYGRTMAALYLGSACLWAASVYAPTTALTVGLFGLSWVSGGVGGVFVSTLNQKAFPDALLGRVTSVKGTASGATLPLGSLLGGLVASALGPRTTVALAAAGFGFSGLCFLCHPTLRRLPAVADATPAAFGVSVPDGE
ncbi:MFS transporter [Halosegnis marinus]|uniref:MFS transporter n=1 Tax=Halosegnis marinus TaxID=3034023 RepID=A0ABD5ZK32_9EURY|nr:MFS transporter [Halosegnis sp. DT85]